MNRNDDILITFGDAVKALPSDDPDVGILGGLLVRFGSPAERDLVGEYFTIDTYFGAQLACSGKAVIDGTLNHRHPMLRGDESAEAKAYFEQCAEKLLPPVEVTPDEDGLMAKQVFDLRDEYQAMVYNLGVKGAFGWSSGSAPHVIDITSDGCIKTWPLIEAALTPTPCEPRQSNTVIPLKTYMESNVKPITKPATPVKSVYFSEYLESDMAMSALNPLEWELRGRLYDLAGDIRDGDTTVAEAQQKVGEITAEYSTILCSAFINLLATAGPAVAAPTPATINDNPLTGPTTDVLPGATASLNPTADDATTISVKGFLKRFPTKDTFVKAGQQLNAKNKARIAGIKALAEDAIAEHGGEAAPNNATVTIPPKEDPATEGDTPKATKDATIDDLIAAIQSGFADLKQSIDKNTVATDKDTAADTAEVQADDAESQTDADETAAEGGEELDENGEPVKLFGEEDDTEDPEAEKLFGEEEDPEAVKWLATQLACIDVN